MKIKNRWVNGVCKEPQDTVDLDTEQLKGKWFLNYGLNDYNDCYECQMISFDVIDSHITFEANFNKRVNGKASWD